MNELRLQGEIVFDDDVPSLTNATLHIYIEDTTLADASARVVLHKVIDRLQGDRAAFTIYGTLPDPRADYSLRALVDVDGDGQIGHGDYVNTISYPVQPGEAKGRLNNG